MTTRLSFGVAIAMLLASGAFAYRNALWIPPWNANALNALQMHLGLLSETNPVWYDLGTDGKPVRNHANSEDPTWRAAMTGTSLLPTIQNVVGGAFNGTAVAAFISSPEGREAHADGIAQLVILNAYDGIDIDYEGLPSASRADFTAFLATLADKLHAAGKQLSVTVYAKTSDLSTGLSGAEDYSAIGGIADWVKVMAYGFHWRTSGPGPIAPLDWIDAVVTYARSAIPGEKIVIGLPLYGYDWGPTSATAVWFDTATQLALQQGATITHDANGEATFKYGDHTVFFQDVTSYRSKIDLLLEKHPTISGFTAWSAGFEDPQVWDVIAETSAMVAPLSVSGPESIVVMQGRLASADFLLTGNVAASVSIASGAFGSLDRSTVRPGESARLTIDTTPETVPGTYPVVLRFEAGSLVRDVNVSVSVVPANRRRAVSK